MWYMKAIKVRMIHPSPIMKRTAALFGDAKHTEYRGLATIIETILQFLYPGAPFPKIAEFIFRWVAL